VTLVLLDDQTSRLREQPFTLLGDTILSPNFSDKNRLTWKMQKLKNLTRQFSTKTNGDISRKIGDLIFVSFKKIPRLGGTHTSLQVK